MPHIVTSAGWFEVPFTSLSPAAKLQLHNEAFSWATFTIQRHRAPDAVYTRALRALRFSLDERAAVLRIPTKLRGVAKHQPRLEELSVALEHEDQYLQLAHSPGWPVAAFWDGRRVGQLSPLHSSWVRRFPSGTVTARVLRVTGGHQEGFLHGCNIALSWPGSHAAAAAHS